MKRIFLAAVLVSYSTIGSFARTALGGSTRAQGRGSQPTFESRPVNTGRLP